MNAPTRIGIVALIILGGCILAIPHFRHPTRSANAVETENNSVGEASTLKLKVDPTAESETGETPVVRNELREDVSLEQHSIIVQTAVEKPITSLQREEWKFPPVAEPEYTARPSMRDQEPLAANQGPIEQKRTVSSQFRPVRLLGNDREQPVDYRVQEPQRSVVASRFERPQPTKQPVAKTPQSQLARNAPNSTLALHRVVNGDTLEHLAQQYYGDPRQSMLIFESNRQVLLNPAILPLGIDLKIPPAINASRQ